MLVAGDREAAESTVSVRSRAGGDLGARNVDQFIADATNEIQMKKAPEPLASAAAGSPKLEAGS
jgi:threonyl-tRNA synthetase